ncbi:nuclear receptor subfamily 2 group F member 1-B-like [Nilaparvata lugens]|uniref:nuclear receptor subfamily 2 group F member 1-B-like n=1 Tax=Nilaparvata lugens TaxID=108931 RepID=UPI00193E8221|nr:nuclear receptor subfamily 2 group F member 1-B-like [Nilaparvata lugens]
MESLCKVCGDKASGKHYGVPSCDGCRGFFKRSIRRNLDYVCKENGRCVVDVTRRNQCQACRFSKCLEVNMRKEAVQHERAPRTNQSQQQVSPGALYLPRGHHLPAAYPLFCPPLALRPTAASYLHRFLAAEPPPCALDHPPPPAPAPVLLSPGLPVSAPYLLQTSASEDEVTSSEETKPAKCPRTDGDLFRNSSYIRDLNSSISSYVTIFQSDGIYDSAAKLLTLCIKCARNIPSFTQLSPRDQSTLLEETWGELFVLSAAQWMLPVDEGFLVHGSIAPVSRHAVLEEHARKMRETISKFSTLRVDHTEYACLKALILFKPGARGLREPIHIELLQDQTHVMLHEYCMAKDKVRFGKLLVSLLAVTYPSKQSLQELFFRKAVGNLSIERLLDEFLTD